MAEKLAIRVRVRKQRVKRPGRHRKKLCRKSPFMGPRRDA